MAARRRSGDEPVQVKASARTPNGRVRSSSSARPVTISNPRARAVQVIPSPAEGAAEIARLLPQARLELLAGWATRHDWRTPRRSARRYGGSSRTSPQPRPHEVLHFGHGRHRHLGL